MKQLSKRDALDWCVKHVSEWPEVKPSIAPDGWRWVPVNVAGELILVDMNRTKYIDQRGWMYHRVFGKPSFMPFKNFNCKMTFQPDTHIINRLNAAKKRLRGEVYAGHHEPSGVTFSQMMGDLCPK